MSNLPSAFFVEYPRVIGDLIRPHIADWRKSYVVEKTINLNRHDYVNFITDLCVDRWFVEENTHLCRVDESGVWHCILVTQEGKAGGILVMSNGEVFPKWAAYLPGGDVVQ